MTHIYYGDPSREFSISLAETLLSNGADILEVGIPYTDPVCDGEIFQRACKRAIENGITPFDVFDGVKILRQKGYKHPIYLTSYYGPIFKIGLKLFVTKAKEVGIRGLIVPDLLLDEQEELGSVSKKNGLSIIQFVTVYSSVDRLKKIIKASNDFIYSISLPGVTGDKLDKEKLVKLIKKIKLLTDKKVFVGFGVQTTQDVKEIVSYGADGVIVGSAIARIYEEYLIKNKNSESCLKKVSAFVRAIKDSTII